VFAPIRMATAQTFPRLGGYLIGGSTTPLTPAHVAPLGVMALGAWEGWTSKGGLNPSQFAAAAKAINPNFRMFIYTLVESNNNFTLYSDESLIPTVPWWLYQSGTSGTIVTTNSGAAPHMNITTYSAVYNGQTYSVWRAQRDVKVFLNPFPAVDGLYVDNVYSVPRVNGDWTLSGSSQSNSDPTTQHIYRLGYDAYFSAVRAAASSSQQMIIGNASDWYTNQFGYANVSDYNGVLNGGVRESIIPGQENHLGWAGMMADYYTIASKLAAPGYFIFSVDGDSATDYQEARYALGSCLLGDGYFYFDVNGSYNDFVTFDEFSANLGSALVPALVFPGAAAWQNGVYRRDFQNGIVLVNPKGNGAQTVTLETSYKHLSGSQAPSVNNGQTVTTVTLNDRDGVILLRTSTTQQQSSAVPNPPTNVSVVQ